MNETRRLTAAQAIVSFLVAQRVKRDEEEHPFFAGCFGIFGHGNVAGIGQALQQDGRLRYVPCRNEQAMVHAAAAAVTMLVAPGPTELVHAHVRRRSLALANAAAAWTIACSFRHGT